MAKLSAGIIAHRLNNKKELEVLLVHPGGPFWKNKDEGAWSIPKGEYEEGHDVLAAAKREFKEETGNTLPEGIFIALTPFKTKGGKLVSAFAIEADFEQCFIKSNSFEMEWPPHSGKMQEFEEVDKAEWFTIKTAKMKINKGQMVAIEELESRLLTDKNA